MAMILSRAMNVPNLSMAMILSRSAKETDLQDILQNNLEYHSKSDERVVHSEERY